MGAANHRLCSVTTYPFAVFGGAWEENAPPHLDQLPRKGDTVVGNDVWLGRESVVMPGVHIGDGAIVAAYSVVTKDVAPYTLVGGNPARFLKNQVRPQLTQLLLEAKWWDWDPAAPGGGPAHAVQPPTWEQVKSLAAGSRIWGSRNISKEESLIWNTAN